MKIYVCRHKYIFDTTEDEIKTLLIALDYLRDAEGIYRERYYETASKLRQSIINALTISAAIRSKAKVEEPAIYNANSLEDLVRKQRE